MQIELLHYEHNPPTAYLLVGNEERLININEDDFESRYLKNHYACPSDFYDRFSGNLHDNEEWMNTISQYLSEIFLTEVTYEPLKFKNNETN